MKRYLLSVIALVFVISLHAQIPVLPEILQEKMDQEQLDLTIDYEELEQEKSEEQYYKFIERNTGSDTLLGYRWNREIEEWFLVARIIKVYDGAELLTDKYFQLFTDDGDWVEGLYFNYVYNANGDPLELTIQHWSLDAAEWVNHFKKTQTYNGTGKLGELLTQWWSRENEVWVNHHLKKFTWNGDLLVADTLKVNHPMTDGLKNHLYGSYEYNDSGLKTSKTLYFFRYFQDVWLQTKRFNYSYDDSGENIILVVGQKWFGDEGWKDIHRYNYAYNDGGNVSVYIFEYWNHFLSDWFEKVKIDYSYNDAGWMNHFVWQTKHSPDADWANIKQVFIDYDDLGNMNGRLEQRWSHFNDEWMNFKKWEMLLQYQTLSGLGESEMLNVKAYFKNPYQPGDQIRFEGLENGTYHLQLFDASGKLVEVKEINQNGETGFYSNLNNGLYILVLSDKQGSVLSRKLLVNH